MKCISWQAGAKGCLILLSALTFGLCGRAADYTVWMESYGFFSFRFVPNYLEIQVGDSVTWRNEDYTQFGYNGYNATCYYPPSTILWTSDLVFPGESSSVTFPYVATYSYRDSYYGDYGMTGTLVVKAATTPVGATLLLPQWSSEGRFQCLVSNLVVGQTYVMQVSPNLVDWTGIATNTAADTVEAFTDNAAVRPGSRFYRSWHLP